MKPKKYDFTTLKAGRYIPVAEATTEQCPKCGRVGVRDHDAIDHKATYSPVANGLLVDVTDYCKLR